MIWVICVEIFISFFIVYYAEGALFAKLKKGCITIDKYMKMESAQNIENIVQSIQYNNRRFIYEYFQNNIKNNKNESGKQACDFVNEEEILKSFTHIQLLKIAPSVITSAGLCCTFIAILLGLAGVQVSSDGNIQGIQNLVNNLAGKFSTSIVALLLAIFLNIKISTLFAKMHEMFLKIEQKIDFYFPVQSIAEFMKTDSGFKDLTNEISSQFAQSAQDLSNIVRSEDTIKFLQEGNNLTNTLIESLTALQKYTKTIQNVANQISNASQSLTDFNKNMANITGISNTLGQIQNNLSQNNQILEENYQKVMDELPKMGNKFAEVCQNMRGNLNGNISQALIDSLKDTLDAHTQQITQQVYKHNQDNKLKGNADYLNTQSFNDARQENNNSISSPKIQSYTEHVKGETSFNRQDNNSDLELSQNKGVNTNIFEEKEDLNLRKDSKSSTTSIVLEYPKEEKQDVSNDNSKNFTKEDEKNSQVIIDNPHKAEYKDSRIPPRKETKQGIINTIFNVFKQDKE